MRYANPTLLVLFLGVGSSAQSPLPDPRFEVASVKPSTPNPFAGDCKPPTCSSAYYRTPPGRFIATRMSVLELVAVAYSMATNRVVGPEWGDVGTVRRRGNASAAQFRSIHFAIDAAGPSAGAVFPSRAGRSLTRQD